MKKKIIGILVVAIFVMSTFVSMAGYNSRHEMLSGDENAGMSFKELYETFAVPEISFKENYAIVTVKNAVSDNSPGHPIMPYKSETLTFPFGTKIESIDVELGNIQTMHLDKKIAPAPELVPLNGAEPKAAKEGRVYESNEPYPSNWFTYNIGAGIQNGEHAIFLSVHAFPARYIPSTDELEYVNEMSIEINYIPPEKPMLNNDAYDLLIVTPSEFSDTLQPLIEHKESYDVKTMLATTEEIYQTSSGRDDAEKVKYFIKNAIEQWGIKYVMLAGGLTSLISGQQWHVPVRYVRNEDGSEPSYISDLYYADIYDADGNFSTWDTNDNGIYGEWRFGGKDKIDGYPDVYVGRLACRNTNEVQILVNKIITYESGCDSSWFNKALLVAGDTFNDISAHNYLEGEVATQKTAEYLEGFEPVKLWWSEGNLKQSNVVKEISNGCGFVHFSGHGSPGMWMAKDFTEDPHGKYILGLDVYHMPLLSNDGKYPVVVIGGCHNSMFNATLADSTIGCIKSLTGTLTWYWMPIPECFGWWIVKAKSGGAIGSIGCTGLGYGTIGDRNNDGVPDCIQYLLGWLETNFFELYGQEHVDILGEMWGGAISNYASVFPPMDDKIDLKTIEEWVLLGDPSLKIGGYSS
ncbi:MAG: C25 family cysteine peptidase [Candidatus Thermoplasmatota archaeon]|nr:C25 family cysteine peptidase [Candidatus Thermoplasmatota archaeon]